MDVVGTYVRPELATLWVHTHSAAPKSTPPTEKKFIQKLTFRRPVRDMGYPERAVQRACRSLTPMSAPKDTPNGSPDQKVTQMGHELREQPGTCCWPPRGGGCRGPAWGLPRSASRSPARRLLPGVAPGDPWLGVRWWTLHGGNF
jgi:hypothetical protein